MTPPAAKIASNKPNGRYWYRLRLANPFEEERSRTFATKLADDKWLVVDVGHTSKYDNVRQMTTADVATSYVSERRGGKPTRADRSDALACERLVANKYGG